MAEMFDYGEMMGIGDLGNEPQMGVDEYALALDLRDTASENQHMQPHMKQDYTGVNPYAEGEHGSWLDESMMGLMDGMGMLDQQSDANAGLALPVEEFDDEMAEDETEEMLADEIELDEASAEFQGLDDGEDDEVL